MICTGNTFYFYYYNFIGIFSSNVIVMDVCWHILFLNMRIIFIDKFIKADCLYIVGNKKKVPEEEIQYGRSVIETAFDCR